jgi:hypothetical protein
MEATLFLVAKWHLVAEPGIAGKMKTIMIPGLGGEPGIAGKMKTIMIPGLGGGH